MAKVTTLLKVTQGFDFTQEWIWSTYDINTQIKTPVDLTGWTSACMVRSSPGKSGFVLVPSLEVTLGDDTGTVTLFIPGDTSWDWTWSRGWYDISLTGTSGGPVQFAFGQIVLDPGVTHA